MLCENTTTSQLQKSFVLKNICNNKPRFTSFQHTSNWLLYNFSRLNFNSTSDINHSRTSDRCCCGAGDSLHLCSGLSGAGKRLCGFLSIRQPLQRWGILASWTQSGYDCQPCLCRWRGPADCSWCCRENLWVSSSCSLCAQFACWETSPSFGGWGFSWTTRSGPY